MYMLLYRRSRLAARPRDELRHAQAPRSRLTSTATVSLALVPASSIHPILPLNYLRTLSVYFLNMIPPAYVQDLEEDDDERYEDEDDIFGL